MRQSENHFGEESLATWRPEKLSAERLPLLITGITGVAGYNALLYFQHRYPGQVVGIRPHQTFRFVGTGIYAIDAADEVSLEHLFAKYRFRSVLNCAGNCALKACELNPAMAAQLNIASAEAIGRCAQRYQSRLVHLSSDLVYSGKEHGNYRESDPVDPVTVYGRTMAEGETVIGRLVPGAAILRISLPMGKSFNRHAGAIDWIDSRFRKDRPATLYFDEVRSCTYTDDLNRVFEWFLGNDRHGLFHAGGSKPRTLYQIAQIVNRVGGYAPDLLKGCYRVEAGPMPPRAGNVSMCSEKLYTLLEKNPFHAWPLEAELHPLNRDWHYHRQEGELGSHQEIAQRLYRCRLHDAVGSDEHR